MYKVCSVICNSSYLSTNPINLLTCVLLFLRRTLVQIKITSMNLDHKCLLNTLAYKLAITCSGQVVLDLSAMSNTLHLLQVNPTMPAGQLCPFLVRHVPSHDSLLSKFISNFRTKTIQYLGVYSVHELTKSEVSQLLMPSTTLEEIAIDSYINKKDIQK